MTIAPNDRHIRKPSVLSFKGTYYIAEIVLGNRFDIILF